MDAPTYILNYEKVIDFYGYWPSFHDARVLDYTAPLAPEQSLVLTLHTYHPTNDVDAGGFFILRNHARITFRFDGIYDFEMSAFASDNILLEMLFSTANESSFFRVSLDSVMDKSGSFSAERGEVESVLSCNPDGSACT